MFRSGSDSWMPRLSNFILLCKYSFRKCRLISSIKVVRSGQMSITENVHLQIVCLWLNGSRVVTIVYTLCFKKRTPKTCWHNFIKISLLWTIFRRVHRNLIPDWYGLSASCAVSMATTAQRQANTRCGWTEAATGLTLKFEQTTVALWEKMTPGLCQG